MPSPSVFSSTVDESVDGVRVGVVEVRVGSTAGGVRVGVVEVRVGVVEARRATATCLSCAAACGSCPGRLGGERVCLCDSAWGEDEGDANG